MHRSGWASTAAPPVGPGAAGDHHVVAWAVAAHRARQWLVAAAAAPLRGHQRRLQVRSCGVLRRKVLAAVNATDSGKRELDQAAIDRAVLREKRNALRYTLVLEPKVPPNLPEHTRPRTARSFAVCPV